MHELFAENQAFRANGRLWVEGPADRFLGIGRLELLEQHPGHRLHLEGGQGNGHVV
ncbi:MAG: hypothetical protein WKG07_11165 [Hymenobacter sp.]